MNFKLTSIVLMLLSITITGVAQKRGAVWCFGDSALVDFSDTSNIITGTSVLKSRGSCASICDSSGKLLFYAGYDNDVYINGGGAFINGEIISHNHTTMANGDSINLQLWYREVVMVDNPTISNQYYVFSIEVTSSNPKGLFYSVVDMSLNGGLGQVIQKNVQLENFKMVDCLTAIKHGNGRDWWVVCRKSDFPSGSNNDYYIYLVTPNGISSQPIQSVGSQNSTNSGRISFNTSGSGMLFINYKGLIELYDFDRCTGLISNPVTIQPESIQAPWPGLWSAEFSPSGNLLYVTRLPEVVADSSRLIQYDLLASNIPNSKITLWTTPWNTTMGQLKMAPDKKIYLTTNYYQIYPYQDTMYNYINKNLSVINSPDSLGTACDLQPFSFYLGGERSYVGLPNNPDYDLPALSGSLCDTLLSLTETNSMVSPELFVYYAPNWQTAFINAQKLKGHNYSLSVYDLLGNEVFKEVGKLSPPYFTKNLNCTASAKGMYVVVLQTDREQLIKKFVIE